LRRITCLLFVVAFGILASGFENRGSSIPESTVGSAVSAQDGCPDTPHPGTENITPYLSRASAGASCPAGSYVRTGSSYQADFLTNVSGSCDVYVWDNDLKACRYDQTQYRGIGATTIEDIALAGWVVVEPNPNTFRPQVDSRLSESTIPDNPSWTFNNEGERTLQFKSNLTMTLCELQPTFVQTQIGFKAVKCVPTWNMTPQQALIHNLPATINVRVPPGMHSRVKTGIRNAIDRWNEALNIYGQSVGPRYWYYESDNLCGGPYCINTEIGSIPEYPARCAKAVISRDDSTGEISGSTITFPTQSNIWNQNFADRTAGHELGHHLGLEENNSGCATSGSLMRPVACNASSGYPTAPTISDHLPVARTTYQGQSTSTCP
jgi:hypothetical protein